MLAPQASAKTADLDRKLQETMEKECRDERSLKLRYETSRKARDAAEEQRAEVQQIYEQSSGWATGQVTDVSADILAMIDEEKAGIERSLKTKTEVFLQNPALLNAMKWAFLAVLSFIFTPYLIRAFFFYTLAPFAERRTAIRLHVPGGAGTPIPPALPSRPSISITLQANEELLVRQDHLQTSGKQSRKHTRFLLDWRYPLTSLLTGLWSLTCIRGSDEVTTISARNDPFSEVTVLELPEGATCVLKPRTIADCIVETAGH